MILIGGVNLSWTKFKSTYLFTVNFAIMLSVILYSVRKDLTLHPLILAWFSVCLIFRKPRSFQHTVMKTFGMINSTILLSAFYFLFFTPFSIIYRLFFRSKAFKKSHGRLSEKTSISDFQYPF
jgi:hypothetical protein